MATVGLRVQPRSHLKASRSNHVSRHIRAFRRLDSRRRYPDRRFRRLLWLLRAATALLLSAGDRGPTVPRCRGNGDGCASPRHRPSHAPAVSHRHGAANRDGRARRRRVRAASRAICHPAARRNGFAGLQLLRAGAAALLLLRLLRLVLHLSLWERSDRVS
jgi:hypothetical protein